ncbi:hypothetical protein ACFSCW_15785 [Sphingomonas tabacisoli]|uniref:Uncharacterized protein n=1 Tax=Sphingomonas tabacisoli TaxID=2249466 RepID=A0ABW4I7N6_9SPHN
MAIATLVQAIMAVPVSLAVGHVLGVVGVLLSAATLALIGTASSGAANWYLPWLVMAPDPGLGGHLDQCGGLPLRPSAASSSFFRHWASWC